MTTRSIPTWTFPDKWPPMHEFHRLEAAHDDSQPPSHLFREGSEPGSVARAKQAQRDERVQLLTDLYRTDLEGFDQVLAIILRDDPRVFEGLHGKASRRGALIASELQQARETRQ